MRLRFRHDWKSREGVHTFVLLMLYYSEMGFIGLEILNFAVEIDWYGGH